MIPTRPAAVRTPAIPISRPCRHVHARMSLACPQRAPRAALLRLMCSGARGRWLRPVGARPCSRWRWDHSSLLAISHYALAVKIEFLLFLSIIGT